MDRDVIFPPVDTLDSEPVDKLRIGFTADPAEQRDPCGQRLPAPGEAANGALHPRARLGVEPVRPVLEHCLEPPPERRQRLLQWLERGCCSRGRRHQRTVRLGKLGLETISGLLRLRPCVDHAPNLAEQGLERAEWSALDQTLEPPVGYQTTSGLDRRVERASALVVVGCDIHQPRRQPPPPPAGTAFGSDDPAPELDRFLTAERDGERRIGRVEQVMALVEQDSARSVLAAARRIDHHQCMVGDDDAGFAARSFCALDEAAAIMRAPCVDALAATVGERGCAGAPEQARQPARQVAADHVAVLAIGCPAPDQLRKGRRPPRERSLQRILEIEEAEIILPPLADDDSARAFVCVGEQLRPFAIKLPLQRFGECRHPHRASRSLGPQGGGRQVGERLADPRARFGKQKVGHILGAFRREHRSRGFCHRALAFARLGAPGQLVELAASFGRIDQDRAGWRTLGCLLPLLEA